ncbi:aminotransferase class V-fold PLP-dependent enzyme [Natronosalvus halobius]|uniref:aminotransferase class V-fold PLP-dependent enzyme n=1 Tax=Natronosalvus halobius TaxID=2953746 RepID=UPI00209DCBC8|nr:aminotransferase class V-fold PLP-dependent enzyme [Natronosalvus halobius]USZ73678.1 aminotransferase class V-fold PLP-dependent enzyme [Natronosalvus halobius]
MSVNEWREQFPAITDAGRIPLNNCSASPIPQRALEARAECEQVWIEAGNPWPTWLAAVEAAKEQFAALINASPAEIAIVSSATDGLARFASALSYDDRADIVVGDLEFPTVPQFWYAQQKRGARLRVASSPDGIRVPETAYRKEISTDTLLVCTSHVCSFTGGMVDVSRLANLVHDVGGYFFLDAYQSIGTIPIDVKQQNIDALVSGTLKFLLGGPGIAFLYVAKDLARTLEPTNMGWFGVDDIFGFETESPTFAPNTRRFELGTPPATVAYQASAGMELIAEIGVERIRERTREHTNTLIEGALDRGFEVRTPIESSYRGSIVNVQVENAEEAVETMIDRGINVSARGGGIRLSPHYFNTTEDLLESLAVIDDVAVPTR